MSKTKFTRVPKVVDLVAVGVPLSAVPTYLALSDHASNRTGETFVSVARIAVALKVCRRTVERHIWALEQAGVVKRQRQRRASRGRFSSCLRVVVSHALFTVRHRSKDRGSRSYTSRTKRLVSSPHIPPDRYRWLMGKEPQYIDEEISNESGQLGLFKPV